MRFHRARASRPQGTLAEAEGVLRWLRRLEQDAASAAARPRRDRAPAILCRRLPPLCLPPARLRGREAAGPSVLDSHNLVQEHRTCAEGTKAGSFGVKLQQI